MSLRDCMEYAVSNSTRMRIQQADRADEQLARRNAVFNLFLPSLSASTGLSYSIGKNIDPETNVYITSKSLGNSYGLSGSITIFNGFSAVNNLKIAKTMERMGLSREQQTIDEICLATMQAFYNVIYYRQFCDIVGEQVETARTSLELARRQEELGLKGHADVVQMEADLASREYQSVNAEGELEDAMITLKDVMFWPVEEPLEIDCSIAQEEARIMPSEEDINDIVEFARSFNPAAIQAKGDVDNARLNLSTARWSVLPHLYISGSMSTGYHSYPGRTDYMPDPFLTQLERNLGTGFSTGISIPILSGFSKSSNIKRMKTALVRAEANYDQKMKDIENEVYRAVRDRNNAEASYFQADRLAVKQEEAYRLNLRKFEQGLISPIEFRTASTQYLEAKAGRLQSLLTYYIKSRVVRYYYGVSYLEQ